MTHHILTLSNILQNPIAEVLNAFGKLFNAISKIGVKRRVYALTLKELDRLSDKELADIGLHRGDIEIVARQTAYGRT